MSTPEDLTQFSPPVIKALNLSGLNLQDARNINLNTAAIVNGGLSQYYAQLAEQGTTQVTLPTFIFWAAVDVAQASAIFDAIQSSEQLMTGQPLDTKGRPLNLESAIGSITISIPAGTIEVDVAADNTPIFKAYDGRFGLLPNVNQSHPAQIFPGH